MLTAFPVSIAIGILLGFLTGLGTGGGSLLLLWLTLVCNMDPIQAKSINLMFFLPAALCATITLNLKQNLKLNLNQKQNLNQIPASPRLAPVSLWRKKAMENLVGSS